MRLDGDGAKIGGDGIRIVVADCSCTLDRRLVNRSVLKLLGNGVPLENLKGILLAITYVGSAISALGAPSNSSTTGSARSNTSTVALTGIPVSRKWP